MLVRNVLLIALVAVCVAFAVPQYLNYQAKLTDLTGEPLDGDYDITFRIFDVASGPGSALWSETHYTVGVVDGFFSVRLGDAGSPIDLPFDNQYWLEIVIGADILTPREPLSTNAYAFTAENANLVNGIDISDLVRITDSIYAILEDGGLSEDSLYGFTVLMTELHEYAVGHGWTVDTLMYYGALLDSLRDLNVDSLINWYADSLADAYHLDSLLGIDFDSLINWYADSLADAYSLDSLLSFNFDSLINWYADSLADAYNLDSLLGFNYDSLINWYADSLADAYSLDSLLAFNYDSLINWYGDSLMDAFPGMFELILVDDGVALLFDEDTTAMIWFDADSLLLYMMYNGDTLSMQLVECDNGYAYLFETDTLLWATYEDYHLLIYTEADTFIDLLGVEIADGRALIFNDDTLVKAQITTVEDTITLIINDDDWMKFVLLNDSDGFGLWYDIVYAEDTLFYLWYDSIMTDMLGFTDIDSFINYYIDSLVIEYSLDSLLDVDIDSLITYYIDSLTDEYPIDSLKTLFENPYIGWIAHGDSAGIIGLGGLVGGAFMGDSVGIIAAPSGLGTSNLAAYLDGDVTIADDLDVEGIISGDGSIFFADTLMGGVGYADSFWIYDDGDTTRFDADNPIKIGDASLVVETDGDVYISQDLTVDGVIYGDGSGLTGVAGDNLGDHTATQNVEMNGHWLSNDGGDEGIYVDSDGNVGIGTTSPTGPLDVYSLATSDALDQSQYDTGSGPWGTGTDYLGQSFTVGTSGYLTRIRINITSSTGNPGDFRIYRNGITGITPDGPLIYTEPGITFVAGWNNIILTTPILVSAGEVFTWQGWTGLGWGHFMSGSDLYVGGRSLASAGYDMVFETYVQSTSTALIVSSDGNIGIGTDTPTEKLDVDGNVNITGDLDVGGVISGDGSGITGISVSGDDLGDHTATQNIETNGFWLSNDGDAEGIFVDATGNVGIGTNSPGERLSLRQTDAGTNNIAEMLKFSRFSSGAVTPGFGVAIALSGENPGGGYSNYSRVIGLYDNQAGGGGALAFETDGFIGSMTERMRIASDGNVGIGTTTPTSALDVAGDIRASGMVIVDTISSPLDTLYINEKVWMDELVTDTIESRGDFVFIKDALGVKDSFYFDGAWRTTWPAGGGDGDWTISTAIGDGTNDTTLVTGGVWGLFRDGNTGYGNACSTHVNLGVACTTGRSSLDYIFCTVGGGYQNTVSKDYGTVCGGFTNAATGSIATVGGGLNNAAGGRHATISGGDANIATGGDAAIGGGNLNIASNWYTTVSGGYSNNASQQSATIGGGYDNTASNQYSTVGGGSQNISSGIASTVGGGLLNTASGQYSAIPGGFTNTDSAFCSLVFGFRNLLRATGNYSVLFGLNDTIAVDSTFVIGLPYTQVQGITINDGLNVDGGNIFLDIGNRFYGVDATQADSFWIYDDGDTTRFDADNPIKVGHSSLIVETDGDVKITEELEVGGDIKTAADAAFYFGDADTDGSWRIIRVGNDLEFQRREIGVWNKQYTMPPAPAPPAPE